MILITGATGLLGAHLLYDLLKSGKKVRAIRRSERNMPGVEQVFSYYGSDAKALLEKVEWVSADILNYWEMFDAVADCSEIYHCAAIVSFDPAIRAKMIADNTNGTANIVNAALEHGVRKLVHVSSIAAIGRAEPGQFADETMIWSESKSNSGYSISKFHSEMEVWRGMTEGLNAAIVNPGIILGPGFWKQGSSSMIDTIYKGLKFYTKGVTAYVGVWDVVKVMRQLMESDISGERYLLSAENLSYQQVFNMIADTLDKPRPSIEATKFMGELAWRMDWFKSKLLRIGEHKFTNEKVRAARKVVKFSNEKVKKDLNFEFEAMADVIQHSCKHYKR